jgi:antitoxin PrlF
MQNSDTYNYSSSERKERHSTLTRKGQVTVPVDVRDTLGLKKGDKVAFVVDKNKKVEFVKKGSVVAQTAGVLKSDVPPLTAEELRIEAERAASEEVMERSK